MKLRLEPNLLRLRLSEAEVQDFAAAGRLETTLHLSPDQAFTYVLERLAPPGAGSVRLQAGPGRVVVQLPATVADEWTSTQKTAVSAAVFVGEGRELRIVVEKDLGYQHG